MSKDISDTVHKWTHKSVHFLLKGLEIEIGFVFHYGSIFVTGHFLLKNLF